MFTDNLVLQIMFYKGTSKQNLLVELVPRLQQVQMRGYLILHVIHIAGTRMIEAVIDVLFRGDNLAGMIRGLNPLKLVLLNQ